jgi:predicted DNA-binding transcriptional regulator AlpA
MAKPVYQSTTGSNPSSPTRPYRADTDVALEPPQNDEARHQVLTSTHPRYVTDTTLAEVIGSSRSTVWRYVQKGFLPPPIRIGCLTRFDLDHAMDCIRAGKVVPARGDRT